MLANKALKGGLQPLAQKCCIGAKPPHRVVSTKAQRKDDLGLLGVAHLAAATVAASLVAVPTAFAAENSAERYKAVQAELQGAPAKASTTSTTAAGGIDPVIGAGAAAVALGGAVFVSQQGKKDDDEPAPQGTKAIKAKPAPSKAGTGSKKVGASTSIKKGGTGKVGTGKIGTGKVGTSKVGTGKIGTGTTKKAGTSFTTPKKPQAGVTDKVTQFIDEPPLPAVFAIIAVGAITGKLALDFTSSSVNVTRPPPQELTREQELEIALSLAQKQAAEEGMQAMPAPPVKEEMMRTAPPLLRPAQASPTPAITPLEREASESQVAGQDRAEQAWVAASPLLRPTQASPTPAITPSKREAVESQFAGQDRAEQAWVAEERAEVQRQVAEARERKAAVEQQKQEDRQRGVEEREKEEAEGQGSGV